MADPEGLFTVNAPFYEKVRQERWAKNLLLVNVLAALMIVLDNWDLGFALVVFLVLKIKADVQMHLYEKDPSWVPDFMKKSMKEAGLSPNTFQKGER